MKITPIDTFEQTFKEQKTQTPSSKFQKSVEDLQFKFNQTYFLYVLPKIVFLDLENDECQVDYPFERIATHYGMFKFMWEAAKIRSHRVNCNSDCPICKWMADNRTSVEVFKIGIANGYNLAYCINDNKIKLAWFDDELHRNYHNSLGTLMNEKKISLIEALTHRIKVYTSEDRKITLQIDPDPNFKLPIDNKAIKSCFEKIYKKPLVEVIDNEHITPMEELKTLLGYLQTKHEGVKREKAEEARKEEMNQNDQLLGAIGEGFGELDKEMTPKTSNNAPITDEEVPF